MNFDSVFVQVQALFWNKMPYCPVNSSENHAREHARELFLLPLKYCALHESWMSKVLLGEFFPQASTIVFHSIFTFMVYSYKNIHFVV